jgi:hypothetical protein
MHGQRGRRRSPNAAGPLRPAGPVVCFSGVRPLRSRLSRLGMAMGLVFMAACQSEAGAPKSVARGSKAGSDASGAPAEKKKALRGWRSDDRPTSFRWTRAIGLDGQGGWRIVASTVPLPCRALTAAFPKRPEVGDGMLVDFWVAQSLESDGQLGPWEFRSAYIQDSKGGRAMVAGGALLKNLSEATGEPLRLEGLELALRDSRAPGASLDFSGNLTATPCPRVAASARHRSTFSVDVSGRKITMHGATVHDSPSGLRIRLSSAPQRCNSVLTEGYDAVLELALDGKGPGLRFATLSGGWFPSQPTGSKGKESFRMQGADGKKKSRLRLKIDAKLQLMKHSVAAAGAVVAERCVVAPAASASVSPPH